MSAPAFTMLDVFEEIDQVVYTFADEPALTAWALDGEATYLCVRPAEAQDVIDPAELYAMLAVEASKHTGPVRHRA